MNVIDINGQDKKEIAKIKEKAIRYIHENDNFVLVLREPGQYIYKWICSNIRNAELAMIGALLLHDGASNCRDVTEAEENETK